MIHIQTTAAGLPHIGLSEFPEKHEDIKLLKQLQKTMHCIQISPKLKGLHYKISDDLNPSILRTAEQKSMPNLLTLHLMVFPLLQLFCLHLLLAFSFCLFSQASVHVRRSLFPEACNQIKHGFYERSSTVTHTASGFMHVQVC